MVGSVDGDQVTPRGEMARSRYSAAPATRPNGAQWRDSAIRCRGASAPTTRDESLIGSVCDSRRARGVALVGQRSSRPSPSQREASHRIADDATGRRRRSGHVERRDTRGRLPSRGLEAELVDGRTIHSVRPASGGGRSIRRGARGVGGLVEQSARAAAATDTPAKRPQPYAEWTAHVRRPGGPVGR